MLNGKPNVGINADAIPKTIETVIYGKDDWKGRLKSIADEWKNIIEVAPNTSAPNAVGGVVGVAEHATEATVAIKDGAKLTGHDAVAKVLDDDGKDTGKTEDISGVSIAAESSNNTVDISFGAGTAGKLGFEGLFSWLGGSSTNKITIDGAALTSFGKGTFSKYGNIDLLSHTNNILTNVVGAIAWGAGGASMGASVGVLDYKNVNDIALTNMQADAASFDADALTDGVLNNVTIAGSMTTKKAADSTAAQPSEQIEKQDDTDAVKKIEDGKKEGEQQAGAAKETGETVSADAQKKTDPPATGTKPASAPTKTPETHAVEELETGAIIMDDRGDDTLGDSSSTSTLSFQLAAAGSVAVNVASSETKATVADSKINIHDGGDGHVNVKAEDGSYIGAYAGAAAVNWQQGKAAQVTKRGKDTVLDKNSGGSGETTQVTPATTPTTQQTVVTDADGNTTATYDGKDASAAAALSGAVAMNIADQTVTSELSGVTITDAKTVQNIAQKDGALVAAGLGLAVSKNDGAATGLTGVVSFNEASSDIDATIRKSDVTADSGVTNIAYDSDTQVAGGANLSFVKSNQTSIGVGASVAISDLHNDIDAMITGSKVTAAGGTIRNHAAENLTQVGAAVGVAATISDSSGVMLDASLASNNAENTLKATVSGGSELTAERVDNAAYDADDIAKPFDQAIENSGVNATGSTYLENATDNAATNGKNPDAEGCSMADRDYDIDVDHGSTKQITASLALTVGKAESGVAGSAAISVGTLQSDMEAGIHNSKITADAVASNASSDAVMVDVAAGGESVSAQYTSDKTKAFISNSKITSDDVSITADSGNVDVNVAGQAGFQEYGLGLAVAANHLGNTTGAYLLGSDVTAKTDDGIAVTVTGMNHDTVVSVGAGVTGGQTAAVNGSLAINQGNDDAEAVIDATTDNAGNKRRTNIKKARKLLAKADDSSTKVAVAGAINGAGTAAVGGALAYNEIGTWEQGDDNTYKNDREQQTHAAVNYTDITTAAPKSDDDTITVTASDTSTIGTAATGIGGSGTAAVDGASTVSVIARESYAEMTGTNIKKAASNAEGTKVHVASTSEGSTYSAAVVAAGSGVAAVGAGVAVNYDNTDSTAHVAGGTIEAANVRVDAATKDKILNIGLGGAGSTNASVAGSLGVNILGGHTRAAISDTALDGTKTNGANVTSDGNVIIAAQRGGSIDNLAGFAAGSGVGASVGASVGVNVIANEVTADLDGADTSVTAKGGTAETVSDTIKDGTILDGYPADQAGALTPATYMTRENSSYKGIAVSASSTNEAHDWALNVTGGGIGASVSGNVAVNVISGKTAADVSAGAVNAGTGDLHVVAHDYANNTAYTGAVAGNGVGAGVGVGATSLTVSRAASATMTGKNATAKANAIGIDADSQFGVANITLTAAGAIAGVANVDNVNILSGKTTALASGYDFTVGDGLAVSATYGTNLHTIGIVAGAGVGAVGLGIDVVQDDSETTAELTDGSVATDNSGNVTVAAESETHDNYKMITETAGGASVSTNVSVGNFDAQTTAHVAGMTIGDSTKRAGAVDIHAKNTTDVTSDTWSGSLSGLGIGAGIQVATIGSDTDTSVENSKIFAKTIDITADDEKKGTFRLGNTLAGGLAGGVNVGVLTVGHKVENTYSITGSNGKSHDSGADLADVFATNGKVNTALTSSRLTADETHGTGIEGPVVKTNNGTDGGKDDTATTDTTVTGSTLDATGDVNVTSKAAAKVKEENIYAAAALGSLSGQVGVLDSARNASVSVKNSAIKGQNVAIGSNLGGTSELGIYQGSASALSAMGAFGFTRDASANRVTLDGNTLTAEETAEAKTSDDSETKLSIYAVNPALEASASFQLAEADVVGSSAVTLSAGNHIEAKTIDIAATSAPKVETNVNAGAASVIVTGDVGISTVEFGDEDQAYETRLDVADGNKFAAEQVNLSAVASPEQKSELASLSITGLGTDVVVNYATNSAYSDVTADIGAVQYGTAD